MILKTKLFGHVYEFKSIREVMAKQLCLQDHASSPLISPNIKN